MSLDSLDLVVNLSEKVHSEETTCTARLSEKNIGASWPPSFHFCRQNKHSGRQKLYLRMNGFSFVRDNGLSLVYIFPKKKVTYLGGQVGEQA